MEDYETETKGGKIERRIYMDSGSFVIYGYEYEGKMTDKYRIVLKGKERKSLFIIRTGKGKNIVVDADFEDNVHLLRDGNMVKVSDFLSQE